MCEIYWNLVIANKSFAAVRPYTKSQTNMGARTAENCSRLGKASLLSILTHFSADSFYCIIFHFCSLSN